MRVSGRWAKSRSTPLGEVSTSQSYAPAARRPAAACEGAAVVGVGHGDGRDLDRLGAELAQPARQRRRLPAGAGDDDPLPEQRPGLEPRQVLGGDPSDDEHRRRLHALRRQLVDAAADRDLLGPGAPRDGGGGRRRIEPALEQALDDAADPLDAHQDEDRAAELGHRPPVDGPLTRAGSSWPVITVKDVDE